MFSICVDHRTSLQLLQQHHKQELFELVDQNRQHLRQWLLWVDKRQSPEDFDPIIPLWIHRYAENNGFDAGIRYEGKLVGMVALHYIDWKNSATSIGYFLSKDSQGKGIVITCIRKLLDYVYDELNLNRVIIHCATENIKSRAIAERLGFV